MKHRTIKKQARRRGFEVARRLKRDRGSHLRHDPRSRLLPGWSKRCYPPKTFAEIHSEIRRKLIAYDQELFVEALNASIIPGITFANEATVAPLSLESLELTIEQIRAIRDSNLPPQGLFDEVRQSDYLPFTDRETGKLVHWVIVPAPEPFESMLAGLVGIEAEYLTPHQQPQSRKVLVMSAEAYEQFKARSLSR